MVNRLNMYLHLLKKKEKNQYSMDENLYIYGCKGIGKSFIVYQLACKLMACPNNLVVYIPFPTKKFIYETIKVLYYECKSLELPEIDQVLDVRFELENKFRNNCQSLYSADCAYYIISTLQIFLQNKRFIFVVDQVNEIFSKTNSPNLFNEVKWFFIALIKSYPMIFSVTASNQV